MVNDIVQDNPNERYGLYVSKKEDIVAIIDNITEKKYSTLEDIIDLVNLNHKLLVVFEDKVNELIDEYTVKKESTGGIVLTGNVYDSKLSVLYELINNLVTVTE